MDSQGTATRQKLNRKKEESKDSSFFIEETMQHLEREHLSSNQLQVEDETEALTNPR